MRIGIDARILSSLDYQTGLYQYTFNLINGLQEIDCENDYLLFFNAFRTRYKNVIKGYSFNQNIHKVNCAIPYRIMEKLFDKFKLPVELFLGKVDLFHSPAFELLPTTTGKSVVTVHDLMFLSCPSFLKPETVKKFKKYLKYSLQKADAIITVSEFTKNELLEQFSLPQGKVRTIYNGINRHFSLIEDRESIEEIKKKYGIKRKYILYLGNIEPKKNILRLIEAYGKVRRSTDIDCDLVVAGPKSYTDYYEDLLQKIVDMGLQDRVIFTGLVPAKDVPLLYNGAEIFVFPSLFEGFGFPPLEAMACGVPVIASNIPPIREVVGDAAILINPMSVDDIADLILSLLQNYSLRRTLREKGMKRASFFTWDKTARQTIALYKEI